MRAQQSQVYLFLMPALLQPVIDVKADRPSNGCNCGQTRCKPTHPTPYLLHHKLVVEPASSSAILVSAVRGRADLLTGLLEHQAKRAIVTVLEVRVPPADAPAM